MAATKTLKRPAEEAVKSCKDQANPPKKKKGHKRSCVVCDTNKHYNQFPGQAKVSSHEHGANICRPCYVRHLEAEIDSKTWDEVACPECPVRLTYSEVESMANPEDFAKYERASIRATLSADPDFRFCLSTTCDSGQVHPGGADEPIFSCQACGHKHCVTCETNWHAGETCEEYQAALHRSTEHDEKSQKEIDKISKPCPQCRVPIQKNSGCDHMTCSRCNHDFCWACSADYNDIARQGNHHHEKSCRHYRQAPSAQNLGRRRAEEERIDPHMTPARRYIRPTQPRAPPRAAALVPAQTPAAASGAAPSTRVQPANAAHQAGARQRLSGGPDRTAGGAEHTTASHPAPISPR